MSRKNDLERLKEKMQDLSSRIEHFQAELNAAEHSRERLYECPTYEVAISQLNHEIENVSREIRDKMDAMM